jgi:hypothetical protein
MNRAIGHRGWANPEGYVPGSSTGPEGMTSVPIVVQHTRLGSRQSENALLSTVPGEAV